MSRNIEIFVIFLIYLIGFLFADVTSQNKGLQRAVPSLLNYQGYLTDTLGVPINDTLDMAFSIYGQISGGTKWWSETRYAIPIERGIFQVMLGDSTAIPDSVFIDGIERWLEIVLEGPVTLGPRTRITAVGYAYDALHCDTAEYARNMAADDDWVRGTPDSVLFTAHYVGIARGGVNNVLHGNYPFTHTNFGVACTTGHSVLDQRYVTVGGGYGNAAIRDYATVAGGYSNQAYYDYAVVAGGYNNTARGDYSAVCGGQNNEARDYSTVCGGQGNVARDYAVVGGGVSNIVDNTFSFIGCGEDNYNSGAYSAILVGYADTIAYHADYSYLFGIGSMLTQDSTFMVDMPHIRFGDETDGYEFPATDGNSGEAMITDGSGQLSWIALQDTDWIMTDTTMYTGVNCNVGIGTAFPLKKLHVTGEDTLGSIIVTPLNAAANYKSEIILAEDLNNTYGMTFIYDGSTNEMYLYGHAGTTIYGPHLTARRNGNIGINKTNPSYALDISGTTQTTGFRMPTGATNGYILVSDASGNGTWQANPGDYDWVRGGINDTVLFTANYVGLARGDAGNELYGDSAHSHVNFGVACTTSSYGTALPYITVSGGYRNKASGMCATVSGGEGNKAIVSHSVIAGGRNNVADGGDYAAVLGGLYNTAHANYSAIGGGYADTVNARFGGVFSGYRNIAGDNIADSAAIVAGGRENKALAKYASVSGGLGNTADGYYSAVVGGRYNTAHASDAFVGGGYNNTAYTTFSSVCGGVNNYAQADRGCIGAGTDNYIGGFNTFVGAGQSDTVQGRYSGIIAGYNNQAGDESLDSAVVVCGGWDNEATADYTFIGGGHTNRASGQYACIGGGLNNYASNSYASVCGGNFNNASGAGAFIGGGQLNVAGGINSSAGGFRAKANHDYTYVWADGTAADFATTGNNQYLIRANGGVGINTNSPAYDLEVAGSVGLDDYLVHNGDANTYLGFNADRIDMYAGGINMMRFWNTTQDVIIFNPSNQNVNFVIESMNDPYVLIVEGDDDKVGIGVSNPSYKLHVVADTGVGQIAVYGTSEKGRGGYYANNNNDYYALTAWNTTGSGATVKGLYVHGFAYATGGYQTFLSGGNTGFSVTSSDMEYMVSGSAVLHQGTASVEFSYETKQAISASIDIRVIATPTEQCNGLYVEKKSVNGFIVKELINGRSSASFDWIVIARIRGYEKTPVTHPEIRAAVSSGN
jgi:hypothetical protein